MEELEKSDAMIFAMKAVLEEGYSDVEDMLGMVFTLSCLLGEYKSALYLEKVSKCIDGTEVENHD